MTTALIPSSDSGKDALLALAARSGNKNTRSRVALYCGWLAATGTLWYMPDLAAWRDALVAGGRKPTTVQAYLSSVRGVYRELIGDNATRDLLYRLVPHDTPPERAKAFVDEALTRLENAVKPSHAKVRVTQHQDLPDSALLRLTVEQANALLAAPDVDTLQGVRDAGILAMLLCTGVREGELIGLEVGDLRRSLGGELALHVRSGKGDKSRLVPYGELGWCLVIVDTWLARAGIASGPVFRGLYKGGATLRPGRLSVRSVERILASYPVAVGGRLVAVAPHDCRRTYARRLYEAGMDLLAIQQNLGHSNLETTLGYIGTMDASASRAKAVFSYDMGRLRKWDSMS